jgi:hypothetical protein
MSFRFAPDKWAEIDGYLAPLDAGRRKRLIEAIELRIGLSIDDLKCAGAGEFDACDKLKRLSEAEQALKDFSRILFRSSPDRASTFPRYLLEIVTLDLPELSSEQSEHFLRPENAAELQALQSMLIDRRLGYLVRKLWGLVSQHKADLREQAAFASRRDVERQSISAIADCGCHAYRLAHGRCPTPRKKNGSPDGPFDRFMMAILEPVAAELRKNRGSSYSWPTLMKYAASARTRQSSTPPKSPETIARVGVVPISCDSSNASVQRETALSNSRRAYDRHASIFGSAFSGDLSRR